MSILDSLEEQPEDQEGEALGKDHPDHEFSLL